MSSQFLIKTLINNSDKNKKDVMAILLDNPDTVVSAIAETLMKDTQLKNVEPDQRIIIDQKRVSKKFKEKIKEKLNIIINQGISEKKEIFLIIGKDIKQYYLNDSFYCEDHQPLVSIIKDILDIPCKEDKKANEGNGSAFLINHIDPNSNFNKIAGVLIYTYRSGEIINFYTELKSTLNYLRDKAKISHSFFVDTSIIFTRIPGKELYPKTSTKCKDKKRIPVGNTDDLKVYGNLVGRIAHEFISSKFSNEKTDNLLTYLHLNSFRFNKHLSILNEAYFDPNDTGLKKTSGFKLTSVSFYVNKIKQYLIDVPYRHYYHAQNEYIEGNNNGTILNHTFLEKDSNGKIMKELDNVVYKKHLNFIYYCYSIKRGDINLIQLNKVVDYENDRRYKRPRIVFDRTWKISDEEAAFKNWLIILHTAIFYYHDVLQNDRWVDRTSEWLRSDDECTHTIEVFWFYHSMELKEEGLEGGINYSFCRCVDNKITSDNDIEWVFNKAREFYALRRPMILAKAKETLTSYFIGKVTEFALQKATSSIFARNYAHHIGSHVKNRTTVPDIRKRIDDLYPSTRD